jgi:prepilin-type N-terminal cleavage/methylation domain-containing protein
MKKKGFSLIEIMVAVAIMAVLSTIALFGIKQAQASARDTERAQIMNGFRVAMEKYYADKGIYPTGGSSASYCSPPIDPAAFYSTPNAAWRANFYVLLNQLYGCGYLTTNFVDPKYKSSYLWKVGTGWNAFQRQLANSCDIADWGAGDLTDSSSSYHVCVAANGQSYTLTLKKEGGGTSVFASPQ